jgi:hypothetical protein
MLKWRAPAERDVMGSSGTWELTLFGLTLKPEIDVGHLLTFITLAAGFVWWLITTMRTWRRTARQDAESGALRLLLYLLMSLFGIRKIPRL